MPIRKRRCTMCGKNKSIDKFYKTKYRCKMCMKDIIREGNKRTKAWKTLEREIENALINYSYVYI